MFVGKILIKIQNLCSIDTRIFVDNGQKETYLFLNWIANGHNFFFLRQMQIEKYPLNISYDYRSLLAKFDVWYHVCSEEK